MRLSRQLACTFLLAVHAFAQAGSGSMPTQEVKLSTGGPAVELVAGSGSVLYARSQTGGAWRSDDDGHSWVVLSIPRDLKVESLVVDVGTLTLAAEPRAAADLGAVLRSSDGGRHFKQASLPYGAGVAGQPGPRLVADPNHPATLLLGTPVNGLWRSDDSGTEWKRVDSFPALPLNGVGLTFVAFDSTSAKPGQASPVILVGVADPFANLLRSDNGGLTWAPVIGGPTGLFPNHAVLSAEGVLYLSYGDAPGSEMTHGGFWSYTPRTREWHEVTPPSGHGAGFNAVTLDPHQKGTLFAADSHAVFETTDGGARWTTLPLHLAGRHGVGALLVDSSSTPARLLYSVLP